MDISVFRERFSKLCQSVALYGGGFSHSSYLNQLISAYTSPRRYYHNITHIIRSLAILNSIKDNLPNREELEYAIFWHDFIITIYNGESELLSSMDAVRSIYELDLILNPDLVADLILETKYNPNTPYKPIIEYNYMFDIDFSILGSDEETFNQYDEDIEKEYGMAFDKNARIKFLLMLLNPKRSIFRTELFREKYEQQARNNIRRILNNKYYQIVQF
ncbi:hypothetical protein KKF61_07830 [Patescibacteria group bacterium]|nr:hypothetical protein [Patescibacteria group bacterium]